MAEKNNNTPRIILFILIFLLLGVVAYFLFFFKWPGDSPIGNFVNNIKTVNNIVKDNLPESNESNENKTEEKEELPPPTSEEVDRNTAAKIASAFVERFGSYSNQSDFGNVTDLRGFMTDSMRNWADNYVEKARDNFSVSDAFYGITTKSVSYKIESFDMQSGTAKMTISTQRAESRENLEESVYYEDAVIEMIKEGNDWKIDGIYWQGKK